MIMTAKEMFKVIGFVPFFETKDLIIYENFPDNKKERIDVIYYVENDKDVFIDMTLLKVINQQCKELGWLDE